MNRGCIAIVTVECDSCHRPIKYGERYLITDGEGDETQRLCIECCQSRGLTSYKTEKGKEVISFFPKN